MVESMLYQDIAAAADGRQLKTQPRLAISEAIGTWTPSQSSLIDQSDFPEDDVSGSVNIWCCYVPMQV